LQSAREGKLLGNGPGYRGGENTLSVGLVVSEKGGLSEGMRDGEFEQVRARFES